MSSSTLSWPSNSDSGSSAAQDVGLNEEEASVLGQMASAEIHGLAQDLMWRVDLITPNLVANRVRRSAAAEIERAAQGERQLSDTIMGSMEEEIELYAQKTERYGGISVTEETAAGRTLKKFEFTEDALLKYFGGRDPYTLASGFEEMTLEGDMAVENKEMDLFSPLCANMEIAVELGKHLRPDDILNLFIACRSFNETITGYMMSSVRSWIAHRCPEAGWIYPFQLYKDELNLDPAGRTWADHYIGRNIPLSEDKAKQTRSIPGLRYLKLVLTRDRCCREIIAIMARSGHLMPKTAYMALLRLWLLMDFSTTSQRQALLRNEEVWGEADLYNAQMFFIKLGLHFNDPVFGPCSYELLHLMLGQKGLYPLWQLLMRKRFTTLPEIVDLKVRYDYVCRPQHWRFLHGVNAIHGVPLCEVGRAHVEGWGKGCLHLMRPDELVPIEAVKRGLHLDDHIRNMVLWGYFDWETGENIVPTEDDMYISDEDEVLAHMDTTRHWRKRHAMKKRWRSLDPEQQQAIIDEDEDERLRALAWCYETDSEDSNDFNSDSDDDEHPFADPTPYTLDDEIRRGFIVPPQPPDHQSTVPNLENESGWVSYVNKCLIGLPPSMDKDELLQVQAWFTDANVGFEEELARFRAETEAAQEAWVHQTPAGEDVVGGMEDLDGVDGVDDMDDMEGAENIEDEADLYNTDDEDADDVEDASTIEVMEVMEGVEAVEGVEDVEDGAGEL
jgi:hypothetical protein